MLFVSCGGAEEPEPVESDDPTEPAAIESDETPTEISRATIVFIAGDAWIGDDDDWFAAVVGDSLESGQSVRVDSGYLELEFEEIGTVRVLDGTTMTLEGLGRSPESREIDIRVPSGTILSKVNRLAGTDSYEVRTETAVIGVRGTEFLVRVGSGADTTIAVQEGRVAVLPVAADPDRIRSQTAESPAAAEAIEEVARQLAATAPVVESGQELTIDTAVAEESAARMAEVEAVLAEIVESAEPEAPVPAEVAERLRRANAAAIESIARSSESRVREISPEARAELDLIDQPPQTEPEPEAEPEPAQPETTAAAPATIEPAAIDPASTEPVTARLRVTTEPADATIEIDGRVVGTGRAATTVSVGDRVAVRARRAGFADAAQRITAGANGAELTLRLEPRPIESTIRATSSAIVRGVVSAGGRVYGADRTGAVFCVDRDRLLWTVPTANGGNENSRPTVAGGVVAFSGMGEFVMISAADGRVMSRRTLSGTESHLFGRRAVSWGERWIYPVDAELIVLGADGGEERRIALPGDSKMSPAVIGNRAVLADQQGTVMVIDLSAGDVVSRVSTGIFQPIAQAPGVDGAVVVVMGRRGVAAAVDTASGTVVWERDIGGGDGTYSDPRVADDMVFFLVDSEILAVSLADGAERYRLSEAAGTIVSANGGVYYGTTGGELRRIAVSTGTVEATLSLPAASIGTSTAVGPRIAVPLVDGRIVWVHTEGIR